MNVNAIYNKEEDYKPIITLKNYKKTSSDDDKRTIQFNQILEQDSIIDLKKLKQLAWKGIPLSKFYRKIFYLNSIIRKSCTSLENSFRLHSSYSRN